MPSASVFAITIECTKDWCMSNSRILINACICRTSFLSFVINLIKHNQYPLLPRARIVSLIGIHGHKLSNPTQIDRLNQTIKKLQIEPPAIHVMEVLIKQHSHVSLPAVLIDFPWWCVSPEPYFCWLYGSSHKGLLCRHMTLETFRERWPAYFGICSWWGIPIAKIRQTWVSHCLSGWPNEEILQHWTLNADNSKPCSIFGGFGGRTCHDSCAHKHAPFDPNHVWHL